MKPDIEYANEAFRDYKRRYQMMWGRPMPDDQEPIHRHAFLEGFYAGIDLVFQKMQKLE